MATCRSAVASTTAYKYGPLPMPVEKQHDVHSLRPMLNPTDEFDAAYLVAEWPEPTEALVNAEDVEDDG